MKILAVVNQKGGTAKTTASVNLAAAMARRGKRVLLVDLDPQASLTEYFYPGQDFNPMIYHALIEGAEIEPTKLGELIELIPATIDLAAAEIQLPAKRNQETTLKRFLRKYADRDLIIIDCPPSLGVLTTNALTAANMVLVPVITELMAQRTVKLIVNTVKDVQETELNTELKIWRILATRYDKRLLHHQEVLQVMRNSYNGQLYPEPLLERARYKDAVSAKADVSELDPEQGEYWDRLAEVFAAENEI